VRRLSNRAAQDPERGSLVIALLVILVLGMLASMVTERAIGSAFISRGHQDTDAAISQADAGLADALYRIDQGAAGTGSGGAFCVAAGDSHCLAASVPAAPGVSYFARQVTDTDWRVESRATVGQATGAVEGHVTDQPMYPFALFGDASLDLGAAGPQTFSSYSPSSPAGQANPDPNGATSIGSNGTITCSGPLGGNVTVAYYGSGGVTSTGTTGCGTYQSNPTRYFTGDPSAPTGALPCPGVGPSGSELGTGFGAPVTLAAGTYVCNVSISLSGRLNPTGPVQLYVVGSGTPVITVASGSYINDQADYCAGGGTDGCSSAPFLPSSQNLEIFTNSTGTIGASTGSGFYLGAVLDAPNASLTGNACSSHYYGAVIVGEGTCSQMTVNYDQSLSTVYGPWAAGSYTQITPSTFTSGMAATGL
jgi:hypothetical protein